MLAYLNGQYSPKENIFISPDDRGFLFADGLYEVIRSYNGKLFQPEAHLNRLNNGARALRFGALDFHYLAGVAETLIQKNDLIQGDATVYFQVTRGTAPRTHHFPPAETPLTVYAAAKPFKPHLEDLKEGINIILISDQRWARCDIKTVGLTANVLANQQAKDHRAQEAVFVRDGVMLEGTHSNFMAILNGQVVTYPKTNCILPGITRQVVLDLCLQLGIPCKETPVYETDLEKAEELMMVGTTLEVTPVVQIHGRAFGSGLPGPITRRLQQALRELIDRS